MVLGVFADGTLASLTKLVHEVNHQVAVYRQLIQVLGTHSDSPAARKELINSRVQCLKTCDTTKNCVMPQLKNETHEGAHSQEFTKQASQFIGSMSCFLSEMRHCQSLLKTFSASSQNEGPSSRATDGAASSVVADKPESVEPSDIENLDRDILEAETMLETLENLITVHFSTKDYQDAKPAQPNSRRKSCPSGNLCSSFKTSYA